MCATEKIVMRTAQIVAPASNPMYAGPSIVAQSIGSML